MLLYLALEREGWHQIDHRSPKYLFIIMAWPFSLLHCLPQHDIDLIWRKSTSSSFIYFHLDDWRYIPTYIDGWTMRPQRSFFIATSLKWS